MYVLIATMDIISTEDYVKHVLIKIVPNVLTELIPALNTGLQPIKLLSQEEMEKLFLQFVTKDANNVQRPIQTFV